MCTALMLINQSGIYAHPYDDVPAGHWAYEAINELSEKGVISCIDTKHFSGNKPTDRYTMASWLAKGLAEIELKYGNNPSSLDKDSVNSIEKLSNEFSDELSLLAVKYNGIEEDLSVVKEDVANLKKDVAEIKEEIKEEPAPKVEKKPAAKKPAATKKPAEKKPAPAEKKPAEKKPAPAPKKEVKETAPANNAGTKVYHLTKRKEDGMWAITFVGGQKAVKLFKTKKEAEAALKVLTENQGATALIRN